jgi:hypothetical protein
MKNAQIFDSKLHTRLIIEGPFFCPHEMKYLGELPTMSIENPTLSAAADLAHFRHFISLFTNLRSTIVENSLQITPFYAKQTQFQKWQKNINTFLAMRYENLGTLMGQKTKPKQTQLKPIKPKTNPIQTQFQG